MTPEVRTTDPEGVDYGWIMQVTFIVTITVGAPVVAVLSLFATLPTWSDRAVFAIRVGAACWFVTLLGTYAYARRYRSDDSSGEAAGDGEAETTAEAAGSGAEGENEGVT